MPKQDEIVIVSVGGSLIVPDAIDIDFLRQLRDMVYRYVKKGKRFVIITGGGRLSRRYQEAAKTLVPLTEEETDWLGIEATRFHGMFLRSLFLDIAHPHVVKNPTEKLDFKERVLIAAGWKPGCSTDFDAVLLAKNLRIPKMVNLTNIDYVYDKDPKSFPDAIALKNLSWVALRKILPENWTPGLNTPFDPVAAKEAQLLNLELALINGHHIERFEDYLAGKPFEGTLVH